jgi:hypothetical protein
MGISPSILCAIRIKKGIKEDIEKFYVLKNKNRY